MFLLNLTLYVADIWRAAEAAASAAAKVATIAPLFDLIDLVKVIDATIFLGVPCAEKITRLWRKTAAPQAGKFWDRAAMRSTAEKEAHARASVRPRASSGETDSVRAADGLQAARPRSVRCWRYSARGHLALALYVRCPERVQELRTATAAQATL